MVLSGPGEAASEVGIPAGNVEGIRDAGSDGTARHLLRKIHGGQSRML